MAVDERWKKFTQDIKRAAELVEIAREGGLRPKRRGQGHVALCPFHDDRDPSLHIYGGESPHYHCYVCDAHGDVFSLYQRLSNVDFTQARDALAARYGIERPSGRGARPTADAFELADRIYRDTAEAGELAEWLGGRGLKPKTADSAELTLSTPAALSGAAALDLHVRKV
ncbi:MAG: CHC2 zinc finger domain-containing protein, partial [Acidobacteriota bacterium]